MTFTAKTMNRNKKLLIGVAVIVASIALSYLFVQLNGAHQEYSHWKSRESVLIKELESLKGEATKHQKFLDQLRRSPDFQEDVARKELGYGTKEEWLYRFPAD